MKAPGNVKAGLIEALELHHLSEGFIITEDEHETFEVKEAGKHTLSK